jgi:hypothetical protein
MFTPSLNASSSAARVDATAGYLLFFTETGGAGPLLIMYIYIKKNQFYKWQLGNKKGGKENKKKNYKMESIHKDILGFLTIFSLRITQANSDLKRSLREPISGCLP